MTILRAMVLSRFELIVGFQLETNFKLLASYSNVVSKSNRLDIDIKMVKVNKF